MTSIQASLGLNTLRPRQNGRHFADAIFKCIFLNENVWIPIKFSLKFVPKGPINNIPALVQIMAWRRPGDKPLSEPMMDNLPTHICVTRPQWANELHKSTDCLYYVYTQRSELYPILLKTQHRIYKIAIIFFKQYLQIINIKGIIQQIISYR